MARCMCATSRNRKGSVTTLVDGARLLKGERLNVGEVDGPQPHLLDRLVLLAELRRMEGAHADAVVGAFRDHARKGIHADAVRIVRRVDVPAAPFLRRGGVATRPSAPSAAAATAANRVRRRRPVVGVMDAPPPAGAVGRPSCSTAIAVWSVAPAPGGVNAVRVPRAGPAAPRWSRGSGGCAGACALPRAPGRACAAPRRCPGVP